MDDELDEFIRRHKARVAADKASLEDSTYLEIKVRPCRGYGSTVKENIPPTFTAPGKDETCNVGLPLGLEYERKKQRLQQELKMDYRCYMAQVDVFPKQRSVLQRNVTSLTEDGCLDPHEDDQGSAPVLSKHWNQQSGLKKQDSDEEEQIESERRWLLETDPRCRKNPAARNNGRGKKESLGVGREDRRWREVSKNKNADEKLTMDLITGAADTDKVLQRKKESCRQEQIAEQHRNKRDKDLELKVAATGASDPEKQPDWIRQFGLSRGTGPLGLELFDETGSLSRPLPSNEKTVRDWEGLRPEHALVAFQSPLLEYSSVLGLRGDGSSSNRQPVSQPVMSTMDVPRNPVVLPHPPSSLSESYRSPCLEPHQYYRTGHLLNPNMAHYAHYSIPGPGFPLDYLNVPPGGAVPHQFANHSPLSGLSFPDPPVHIPSNDVVDPPTKVFSSERPRSTRNRTLSYRDALKQQIEEQQERRRMEREERERHEAQLEADMKNHQPWGRGGGGAPLRDSMGNLIADLKQMHKQNEEAFINPEAWQRRAMDIKVAHQSEKQRGSDSVPERSKHDTSDRLPGFTRVQAPQFARGKIFASQSDEFQLQEQDKYKAYLKQQIEEKIRKKAEEREKLRLEEEKEEKRLSEQRQRIQREYEEEQEKKKKKEMDQRAKNEELIRLAEQKRMEAEKKMKEEEEESTVLKMRQYERERQTRVEVHREPSPPIPTLQRKHGWHQPPSRPPSVTSQHSEGCLSGLQSPPVPACRNQLRAAGDQRDVFSELSALRRQLRSKQKRLETHLQQDDWEELDSPISMRFQERPEVDVFDMARLRLQAPVRRPNSQKIEPRNLLHIHDSLQLKYPEKNLVNVDGESRLDSSEDVKHEKLGIASRRSRDYRDSYHQFSSQSSTAQDDYFDMFPRHQNNYLRHLMGSSRRGFLLESESAFIDPLGEASPVAQTSEHNRIHQLSARERRRLARQSQQCHQELAASSQPVGPQDDYLRPLGVRMLQEADPGGHLDTSDEDLSPVCLNHKSSVETVCTNPWMQPEPSDLMRKERLAT
uniref:Centrosome and spindle pole associated protein 1 n=1 Tax=Iconisemion striatum TaxID=60296 RepID=A0A1A7YJH4_9TELE